MSQLPKIKASYPLRNLKSERILNEFKNIFYDFEILSESSIIPWIFPLHEYYERIYVVWVYKYSSEEEMKASSPVRKIKWKN